MLGTQKLVFNYPSKIEVEQEGTTFHKLGTAASKLSESAASKDYNLLTKP